MAIEGTCQEAGGTTLPPVLCSPLILANHVSHDRLDYVPFQRRQTLNDLVCHCRTVLVTDEVGEPPVPFLLHQNKPSPCPDTMI